MAAGEISVAIYCTHEIDPILLALRFAEGVLECLGTRAEETQWEIRNPVSIELQICLDIMQLIRERERHPQLILHVGTTKDTNSMLLGRAVASFGCQFPVLARKPDVRMSTASLKDRSTGSSTVTQLDNLKLSCQWQNAVGLSKITVCARSEKSVGSVLLALSGKTSERKWRSGVKDLVLTMSCNTPVALGTDSVCEENLSSVSSFAMVSFIPTNRQSSREVVMRFKASVGGSSDSRNSSLPTART